jgi:outer membrane protein assembly factor BamB
MVMARPTSKKPQPTATKAPARPREGARLVGAPAAAVIAIAAALGAPRGAGADVIDPLLPRAVTLGAPRGAAPSERLDGRRTGRARGRLPQAPVEMWRRHVTAGIEQPPLVDTNDNILLTLATPEALKLGPDGKEIWRARLGSSPAAAAPVLTNDGTLVVITAAGQAWGLAPNGAVRFVTSLGVRGRDVEAAPLALEDGGVLVASGATLVEIDRDGAIRARASVDARVGPGVIAGSAESRITGALIEAPRGATRITASALFTTESGAVYGFRPPGAPRRLGTFGGQVRRGAVLANDRTLLAVVDGRRLVALDLPTGSAHVLTSAPPLTALDGPVAVTPASRGELAIVALQNGTLLGLDAAGNEKLRVLLDKQAPPPDAFGSASPPVGGMLSPPTEGFFGNFTSSASPPVIVDAEGRVAFVRLGGRLGVVDASGAVALASERPCASPTSLTPAGDRRMLLACRDGGLWLYGE